MRKLLRASKKGHRIDQLIELRNALATAIDNCESMRDLAALSRQYRETIYEIEEIENYENSNDELSEILDSRKADGKPGAVRKNRTDLS